MALSPAFLDELRARIPLHALVARRVKLSKSGRNWKGCCPFHGEKSPSFYVYDDHFHCFGCGAHGDAISFAMQSGGGAFMDAVEQLASEAGLEVPKPTPQAAEAERERLDLHGVLDLVQESFVRRLHAPEGAAALDYLRGRGLRDATIAQFGLGWSGDGRGALVAEMAARDVDAGRLLDAGLMRAPEESGALRELYWGRVTFPIRDRRGRLISFGGRALGDAKPKYINGPETALFSKKRTLFAHHLARETARQGGPIIVAEGYMDVIALHQAGFRGAVAPLGTALTAEQLDELWRLSPSPILCFDGDAAGGRAASRAAELALPLLTPVRSLRLASLPAGEDPDSITRRGGPAAMQAVLDAARPLADALFDLMRDGVANTPEGRAGFLRRLDEAASRIGDRALASEYRQALRERFYAARRRGAAPIVHRPARPTPDADGTHENRARFLVAILLHHPGLLPDVEEAFAALVLPEGLARVRDSILHWSETTGNLDSAELLAHLNDHGADSDVAQALSVHEKLPACALPGAMPAEAEAGWWHFFGLMHRTRLEEEVAAASRDFAARSDDATQRRLIALCTARDALVQLDGAPDETP